MRGTSISLACVVLAAAATSASAVSFYQKAVVDLTPVTSGVNANDIGSNASAVAWDGTNAYLAGFNNGATARDTALVTVSTVLTTPTFSSRYGLISLTPSGGRGYIGLDYKAGVGVANVFDSGSAATVGEFTTAGTQVFTPVTLAARPPAGPNFDPFPGSNRLSYIYQNSGLVRNVDVTTGASTGQTNTNLGTTAGAGTLFRDIDYANNGDLFVRTNNQVARANRVDATTFSATGTVLAALTTSNNIGQSVSVVEGYAANSLFAVYNDHASNATGQLFTNVVKAVDGSGAAVPLSFLTTDGTGASALATSTSTAFYDFSYDASTQSLAVLDFTNRQLYIFSATPSAVAPEPTTLAALAGVALVALRRRK